MKKRNIMRRSLALILTVLLTIGTVMPSFAQEVSAGETTAQTIESETGSGNTLDSETETKDETLAESMPLSESESVTESETSADSNSILESETSAESKSEAESESAAESETVSESDAVTESENESETETVTESENESEGEYSIEDDPEADRSYRQSAVYDSPIMPFAAGEDRDVVAYGIDVSYFQGDIDWQKVKAAGVDFAIIRVALRGYGTGEIVMDPKAIDNLKGAQSAGVGIGAYFFSTSLNEEEAVEEAEYLINVLKDYNVTYPVVFDFEGYEDPAYRTYGLSKTQRSNNAIAFLTTIENAGYHAAMYGSQSYLQDDRQWDTSRISALFDVWVAQYFYYDAETRTQYPSYASIEGRSTTYTGDYIMWQFTSQGEIDGISGDVDLNLLYEDPYEDVRNFVRRLYTLVLDRNPDNEGLESWVNVLVSGETTGAEVVRDFILSPEFIEKNVSNEDYIEILYNSCMDRSSDSAGKNAWMQRLAEGFSRLYVLRGFIESDEFSEICRDYGIVRGNVELTENRDQNDGITRYVSRCYNIFLERQPDIEGLNDWTGLILANKSYAAQLPDGFIGSDEFVERNLSNEEFVTICYKAILDRDPDEKGLAEWVARLKAGDSRHEVLSGFTDSIEFKELLAEYGL